MDEEVEIILQQDSVDITEPLVADYVLPTATADTLGGVKIGNNINIDSTGHISVPTASGNTAGVIKVGTGLTIDANGVLSSDISELPQATKNSLGVVYVDDELNTLSQNPVQNAVVSLEFQELNGDITTLNGTVGGLSTTVGNLSTSLGNLSTTVGNLSGTVTNQGNAISTIEGNITTIQGDITDIGNNLGQLAGNVDPVLDRYTEELTYEEVDDTVWSNGLLNIYKRGYTGVIYSTLEGSLTIAGESSEVIYTIADSDYFPLKESIGYMISDLGMIRVGLNTSGEFTVYNDNNSSVTITELKGNLPVVFV